MAVVRNTEPGAAASGVILYDKPSGVTSHDVVEAVRRRLARKVKVGHAGSLDPFATGLLLVLVGRATRAQQFLMGLPKTYLAVARLGFTSDTGDRDGRIVETGRVPEELDLRTGELWQRPPAYSAVKVGGERLYRKARRGEPQQGEPRRVHVYRHELRRREGDRAELEIECSAGTYVRALVAELDDAYCEELRRITIGPFRVDEADDERIVPLAEALAFLPERPLKDTEAERVGHGGAVGARADSPDGEPLRLTHRGRLVAIARRRGDELRPSVVFEPGG